MVMVGLPFGLAPPPPITHVHIYRHTLEDFARIAVDVELSSHAVQWLV